jgi:hypothetical protein
MRRGTLILLVGAVVVASGAYALGTQVGGGSAAARDQAGEPDKRFVLRGPGDDLADELGVDPDELEDALRDFREQKRDAFAEALADALGKTREEVERALEEAKPPEPPARPHGPPVRPPEPFRGLARELDVTAAELREALRELWRDRPRDRGDELAEFLAERFKLEVGKVREALDDTLPPFGGRGFGLHGPPRDCP